MSLFCDNSISMGNEELIKYFMEATNSRFDKIDAKLDRTDSKIDTLQEFRWQIIGGSVLLSIAFSTAVAFLTK